MKYTDFLTWTIPHLNQYLQNNPNNIAAYNALAELERQNKQKDTLVRLGKKSSRIDGRTNVRRKGKCPTKRLLQ